MSSAHREIPESLMGVTALGKGEASRLIDKAVKETLQLFATERGFPTSVVNYMTGLRFAAEVFKSAPDTSYKSLKERERRKFSKEITELTEHPLTKPGKILKVMKAVNEILELMLEHGEFFRPGGEHHDHHTHVEPHHGGLHNIPHRSASMPKNKITHKH